MNVGLILAGGTGTRVGASIPKQFISILGKPILAYTLEVFQKDDNIDAIEIVCHKDWKEKTLSIVKDYGITKFKWMTEGGKTFQESVRNGIYNLKGKVADEDIVVISFGVSPMTTPDIIDDSIRVAKIYGNGVAAEDIVLCTCLKETEEYSKTNVIRETLKGFSNPWTFKFGEVYDAYKTVESKGVLNEIEPHTTSIYFYLGKPIYFSKTVSTNIKITTKEDLDIFEGFLLLMQKRKEEQGE